MTSKWNGAPGTTAGPWVASLHPESDRADAVLASGGRRVAYCQPVFGRPHVPIGERVANAHQIAASGALYDALAEVSEWISNWSPNFADDDEWPETAARVRAALALARGTS